MCPSLPQTWLQSTTYSRRAAARFYGPKLYSKGHSGPYKVQGDFESLWCHFWHRFWAPLWSFWCPFDHLRSHFLGAMGIHIKVRPRMTFTWEKRWSRHSRQSKMFICSDGFSIVAALNQLFIHLCSENSPQQVFLTSIRRLGQSSTPIIPKRCQKSQLNWPQFVPKITCKMAQKCPKWSQNYPKMSPESTQKGAKYGV